MAVPSGPSNPVTYANFYSNLPAIVKKFVMIFFTKATYSGTFFSGILTATVFAGTYVLPKSMGGGTYAYSLGVPGPNAGTGLTFLVAALAAWAVYAIRPRRADATSN